LNEIQNGVQALLCVVHTKERHKENDWERNGGERNR